jgi:activator of HSP90 ATPase
MLRIAALAVLGWCGALRAPSFEASSSFVLGYEFGQAFEPLFPKNAVPGDPPVGCLERRGLEEATVHTAVDRSAHQPRALEARMTQRILQEITLPASPARIYEALTNAAEFSKMLGGAPTEIDATAGRAFSCFGGMIVGRNIECSAGERVVQAWRPKTWPAGIYSIVRFELQPDALGTRLTLEHVGFPEGQAEHLTKGWEANYLGPLQKTFA